MMPRRLVRGHQRYAQRTELCPGGGGGGTKNPTEIARVLAVPTLSYSREKLPMHLWNKKIIDTKPKDFPS
jgi:hypothetical protein